MDCARQGCDCAVGEGRFELDGRVYCCEKCARVCSDGHCVCSEGDAGH